MKKTFLSVLFVCIVSVLTGCQSMWKTEENIKTPRLNLEEEIAVETGNTLLKITETNDQMPTATGTEISSEKNPENKIYENKELGIRFTCFNPNCKEKLTVDGNKIFDPAYYIKVFNKEKENSVEETILNIVQEEGKDISKCKVVNKGLFWGNKKYDVYVLDLANSNIEYTEEEFIEIERAEQEAIKDRGPFNGEHRKRVIYNRRLVEVCSYYAEPLGLGTSSSSPSMFIYNQKNKMVFLLGTFDQPFYRENSIELMD